MGDIGVAIFGKCVNLAHEQGRYCLVQREGDIGHILERFPCNSEKIKNGSLEG